MDAVTDCFRFGKFSLQICEFCGALYQRNRETFIALRSTASSRTSGTVL